MSVPIVQLSAEHVQNLARLADFLHAMPASMDERFDMLWFTSEGNLPEEAAEILPTKCGTSGCALGWATVLFQPLPYESWRDFAPRVFGLDSRYVSDRSSPWGYCFSSDWSVAENNTSRAAAERIFALIDKAEVSP